MELLDLAKRCGATIQEVAHTIEIHFKESLPISASTHVPDRYVSEICAMYEVLGKQSIKRIIDLPKLNTINTPKPNVPNAKTFGNGEGNAIKLNVIAKELKIGVATVAEAFDDIFQGNRNPNSRVTPDLAKKIFNFFGKEFVEPTEIKKPVCSISNSVSETKAEHSEANMSSKSLLKFLQDAVDKKCLMAKVLGHDVQKEVYFVDVLGFKSLLYESEVKSDVPLAKDDMIEVVPTKVVGENKPKYMAVSMKRVDKVKRYEQAETEFSQLEINSIINTTVYKVLDSYIIVEFGQLRGTISKENLFWGNVCRIDHYLQPGTPIEARVISKVKEDYKYKIRLNHKVCIPNIWEQVEFDTTENGSNEVEKAEVVDINEKGMILSLGNGFEGFLPIDEMSYGEYRYYLDHDGETSQIDVCVKDFNAKKRSIKFTRQPFYDEHWKNIETDYKVDELYSCKILRVNDDGLLVELQENIEAFVPHRDLFWEQTKIDSTRYNIGDEVNIIIKRIDKNERRIRGSIRDIIPDPWQTSQSIYAKGQIIKVRAIENGKDSLVVETESDHLIGKMPYSEISWLYSAQDLPQSMLPHINDILEAKIIVWKPEKRLLQLSLRQLKEDPWSNIVEGGRIFGIVGDKAYANGGHLVNLDCGIEAITTENQLDSRVGESLEFKIVKFDKSNNTVFVSHTKLIHDEKMDKLVQDFFMS